MVEVRFACIPPTTYSGELVGVKCTLDGVVKYTDASGICSFFDISQGDHTYSVETPPGWKFDYGEGVFGDPIPQSGTTTIEWTEIPGMPWPEDQPWVMKFIFIEEAALGEFRFIAWSLLEKREIMVKDINGDKYDPGMTVKVKFKAKNFGDEEGVATVKVKDLDTGDIVTTYTSPSIPVGNVWKTDGATIGKMPKRDWRLEFKVTP